MNPEELDRELDKWLDRASAEFSSMKTRPGFESRILANVSSRLEKRRWRFRWASIATATAAILVISCYMLLNRFQEHAETKIVLEEQQKPEPSLPRGAQREQLPSIIQADPSTGPDVRRQTHPKVGENEKKPFLSAELSDQERYLISFVHAVSAQTSPSVLEAESGPLQIPAFEIRTLQIPKAQIFSIEIETVQLPMHHQSEDQL